MTRFKMPPFSRRGLLGTGAATLLAPSAFAQSALGGGSRANRNNGPAINVSGAQSAPIPIAIATFTDPSGAASDSAPRSPAC